MGNSNHKYIYYQMSDIKNTIKDLIGEEKFEALKKYFSKQNFMEVKAKDGSVLVYEGELAEGVAVFVVTSEGNKPVEGVVELEDGTVLETEGGLVTKITKMTAPDENEKKEDEVKMEGVSPEVQALIDELKARIEALEAKLGEYAAKPDINEKVDKAIEDLNTLLASKDETKANFTAIDGKFKQVVELMNEIANLPVAPAKEEKFEAKSKRETKIKALSDSLSKLK